MRSGLLHSGFQDETEPPPKQRVARDLRKLPALTDPCKHQCKHWVHGGRSPRQQRRIHCDSGDDTQYGTDRAAKQAGQEQQESSHEAPTSNSVAPVTNHDAVFGRISLCRHAISLAKEPFPEQLSQPPPPPN